MPDFSLAPVPPPFAGSAATRRNADARTDGDFAAVLDDATAIEVTPPARARTDTGSSKPVETVETVETSDDTGSWALDPAAPTPVPTIGPPVAPPPALVPNASIPESTQPQDAASGAAAVPVSAGGDATPVEPPTFDSLKDKSAATPEVATAAGAAAQAALTAPPASSAPAGAGSQREVSTQTPRATEAEPTELLAQADVAAQSQSAREAKQAIQADQATRADRAEQAKLAAPSRTEMAGATRASPLQTASIAAVLPVVPPVSGGDEDGTDVPEVPVVGADAAAASPEEAPSAPPPTPEAPRTRDAIDRANAGRAGESGRTSAADPGPGGETGDIRTRPASAPAAASDARPATLPVPEAAPALVTPTEQADPPIPALASAEATTAEARAAEAAQSLSLSTTSRASVETTAQIAAQIVRKLEGRSTRFEMALTPEGLGQVDVSLDIDADGQLVARLAFDNPLAATELRGRVDELRRQLQEAGFTVADDALSFSQRDPSAGQGSAFDRRPDPRNARAFGAASRLSAEADLTATPARWMSLTLTPDRVDMKV